MKYYIPTTTLNYNNILSTESISPPCFYAERAFGYTRWACIDENPYEDRVLLYSSPVLVRRPKGDREDHSLIIEIESDKGYPELQPGVHYAQETIYLDPGRVRFIFDSEEHRRATLSMSQGSLETKLVHLYRNDIEPYSQVIDSVSGLPDLEEKHASDFAGEIDKDRRVNKLKGMLYGFYIGAMLSPRMRYVDLRRCLRKLWNSCSVVLSQGRLASKDEAIVSEGLDKYKQSLFSLEFEKVSTYQEKRELDTKIEGLYSIPRLRKDVEDGGEKVTQWFEKQRRYLTHRVLSEMRTLSIGEEAIVADKDGLIKLSTGKELPCFIKGWFNDVLLQAKYDRNVSTHKDELLKDLVLKSKEAMESAYGWEGTPEKDHLNAMRRIAIGEEKPQFDWSVNYTASLLAVVTRGDDWQKVIEYLEDIEHSDYSLAFAYYGVLYGFASLPRDFTDVLYLYKDKTYLSQMYAELHGQLHGEKVECNFDNVPTLSMKEPEGGFFGSSVGGVASSVRGESTAGASIRSQVMPFVDDALKGSVPNKSDKKKVLEKALANFRGYDIIDFMAELNDYSGWEKSNKPWGRLLDALGVREGYEEKYGTLPQSNKTDSEKKSLFGQSQESDGLFEGQTTSSDDAHDSFTNETKLLLEDSSWWEQTAELISDKKAREQYLKDVEWFVGNHKEEYLNREGKHKGEVTPGKYRDKDKSNPEVWKRFRGFLERRRDNRSGNTQWLVDQYKEIPIEQIIEFLRKNYGE